MKLVDIPTRFDLAWGAAAGGSYIRPIPVDSQIGIQNGAASLTDGFPPLTFTPVDAGGTPPFGEDMNGILNQITAWTQAGNAGVIAPWDSAFSTAIGGYPQGSLVQSATDPGTFWVSATDDNTSNPDTGGANWATFPGTEIQQQSGNYVADTGVVNAYVAVLSPAVTDYADVIGTPIRVMIGGGRTNTSGVVTLKLNGLTAKTVLGADGQQVLLGYLAAGMIYEFVYDGTNFRVNCSWSFKSVGGNPTNGGRIESFTSGVFGVFSDASAVWGAKNTDAGNAFVSSNSQNTVGTEFVQGVASKANLALSYVAGGSSTQTAMALFYGASQVGSITVTPSGTAFNPTSDERVKSDVGKISDELADKVLDPIEPKSFRIHSAENPVQYGLLAQSTKKALEKNGVDAVAIGLVAPGTPDGHRTHVADRTKPILDEKTGTHKCDAQGRLLFEGKEEDICLGHPQHILWGVDITKLIPFMLVSRKKHQAMLKDHETRIAALEKALSKKA